MWVRKERVMTLKYKAFTLAEVLVTLGIIGVVAALTMPTLMSHHKNQVTVSSLKRAISVLNNGVTQMMAAENTDKFKYLKLYECNPTVVSHDGSTQTCLRPYFAKYFKIVKDNAGLSSSSEEFYPYKSTKNLKGNTNILVGMLGVTAYYCFISTDSILYCPFTFAGLGDALIDVNATKGPNQIGRDIFLLKRNADGVYVPKGGDTWNDSSSSDYCNPETGLGYGCAARVIQEGTINY